VVSLLDQFERPFLAFHRDLSLHWWLNPPRPSATTADAAFMTCAFGNAHHTELDGSTTVGQSLAHFRV